MPTAVRERIMSAEERQDLRDRLDRLPSVFTELRLYAGMWLGLWGVATGLLIGAWLIVAWIVRVAIGLEIWVGHWAIPAAAISTAFYVAFAAWRSAGDQRKFRHSLLADLAGNTVVEEHYDFTDALRMQEREHGGLMYFLRGTDGAVLVLYDVESQDIGVQGENPLTSSFRPQRTLCMVRAPVTGLIIGKAFSGEPLDAGEPLDLLAPPAKWPEDERVCGVAWEKLKAVYCR